MGDIVAGSSICRSAIKNDSGVILRGASGQHFGLSNLEARTRSEELSRSIYIRELDAAISFRMSLPWILLRLSCRSSYVCSRTPS